MAVCNLFKNITSKTGSILTFSQYSEDLTRERSEAGYYHVVPSKFICMDLNLSTLITNNPNKDIPTYFQNYFENACAYVRQYLNGNWTPNMSLRLFWKAMQDKQILPEILKVSNGEGTEVAAIKFIGDINIQSFNIVDGTGYSDIFCYIPDDAQCKKYTVNDISADIPETILKYPYNHILGYDKTTDPDIQSLIDKGLCETNPLDWDATKPNYITPNASYNLEFNSAPFDQVPDKFTFNTILILYDIVSDLNSPTTLFRNIPLGIYFTGDINPDGTINNPVTKYTKNNDIYGAGTSYGLKICNRFTVDPNMAIMNLDETELTPGCTDYGSMCELMGLMAENQVILRDILTSMTDNQNFLKESLAAFKNSRTNVPYVKNVNGVDFWFVNGRNTGQPVRI